MSLYKLGLTIFGTCLFCCTFFSPAMGQKDATLDVPKPERYENRVLGSDKTFTTKYTIPRKLVQNTTTHYNYYFNANIKIEDVIAGAKQSFREDYTELLPFYNYSLDATSSQKTELDSVIQKANAAILLHDLRNEWVDDMYLLMGKAFFLKKDFDSAFIVFQYINYYFQPKTKEELGFKKYIGSNLNEEGNVYSVSTSEKRSLLSRTFNKPPGRNDALLWLLHTLIEDSAYVEASALIQTLRRDELFPERLRPSLEEKRAYLFYKHAQWDSAAHHLNAALDNAANRSEKARWEFLLAQLHALNKNNVEAEKYYNLAIKHTFDPVMEVYARLNIIKLSGEDNRVIEENIAKLLKMARRDRYYNYRGVIYYMAAQMEMQRDNYENARKWLLKGVSYNKEDLTQRNRSYLYLGDIAFQKRDYMLSHQAYDSLDINSPVIKDPDDINERKTALLDIVKNVQTIHLQDSLQTIAALPEAEREKFLKAAVKRIRKERGIKDDRSEGFNTNNPMANAQAADMFAGSEQKGEWYFYNNASKSRGFTTFRSTWGTRPNIDNWRRQAVLVAQMNVQKQPNGLETGEPKLGEAEEEDISYEGLLKKIPMTEEAINNSNDSIQLALFDLGKIFKDKFEDYREAIYNYEALLERFPETVFREETLFYLHYCYTRLGLPARAREYKAALDANYKQSRYRTLIDDPKSLLAQDPVEKEATRNYEEIYDLFVEGNFEEALKRKQSADSIYGNRYWTQQLLYIESVYYIKQRQDEEAIDALKNLISVEHETPIARRAENIINVLKRRAEIEKYLTELEIGDSTAVADSTGSDLAAIEEADKTAEEVITEEAPERVPVQGTKQGVARKDEKPKATDVKPGKQVITRPPVDSTAIPKATVAVENAAGFTYNPDEEHFVLILLNKVDGIYVTEAKNAFGRYNRENFSGKPMDIAIQPLDEETTLLTTSGFGDGDEAKSYLERTVKMAGAQIVPWLAAGKYSFTLISATNLKILLANKELESYKRFAAEKYALGD